MMVLNMRTLSMAAGYPIHQMANVACGRADCLTLQTHDDLVHAVFCTVASNNANYVGGQPAKMWPGCVCGRGLAASWCRMSSVLYMAFLARAGRVCRYHLVM